MRSRAVLRRLARRTAGGPPAVQVGRRAQGAGYDERLVRAALELAVRTGEAMLSLGSSAGDASAAVHRVARAFGVPCQVDLTFTAVLVSHDPGPDGTPVTVLRVVETRTSDYGRLTEVLALAGDLTATPRPDPDEPTEALAARLEQAHARLDEIVARPHPYRRGLITLLLSVMAAGVAVLLGGGAGVAAVAGATTAVIDRVLRRLGRWGIPPFFLQAAGAAVATTVAVAMLVLVPLLPVERVTLPPSVVVASGIVVLLAGLSLVGAAEDAINGFPVTAVGRVFEVLVLTLGLVVGIGAVLDVAQRAGVSLDLVDVSADGGPLGLRVAAAAVVSGAWALASYAPPRVAAVAAGAGATGMLAAAALGLLGVGPAASGAGAALVVGLAAELLGGRLRVPPVVTSVCGIVPLLPGLAIYRGLFVLVDEGGGGQGGAILLGAAMVAVGLAAGVTLGGLLGRPLRSSARPLRSGARRLVRPGRRALEQPTRYRRPWAVAARDEVPKGPADPAEI
ncbi:threonine/serine ThrE exporter family protein [Cellulomonas shaoxiangyii]|uniref:Threonine/serine exporter family protein n=1 Tax=Cellulomonas shaoxiangyii TaxID=2566013 RepID=A0A4P7SHZ8_9CELL|nr:threonine/serine exporter family protein [Cellulomonas shaoxiangyii]QCB93218.1 threonine/serine exporter family protein [Cellulomonas shaoxiangyii]TGY81416.1 threonine/serine exporter family protein [Cellulomonas shaoxiangyii]